MSLDTRIIAPKESGSTCIPPFLAHAGVVFPNGWGWRTGGHGFIPEHDRSSNAFHTIGFDFMATELDLRVAKSFAN